MRAPAAGQDLPAIYPGDPPEFDAATAALADVDAHLPATNRYRKLIDSRFKVVKEFKIQVQTGSHPLVAEAKRLVSDSQAFADDFKNYDEDGAKYEASCAAYGSTPLTKENASQMAVWGRLLDTWRAKGLAWMARLSTEEKRLNDWKIDYVNRREKIWSGWLDDLRAFTNYANGGVRLAKIEAELEHLKPQIQRDRMSIGRYGSKLPGFHEDVEKMAFQAEEAREEGKQQAYGFGLSLAIDSMAINSSSKQAMTQAKLRKIKEILVNTGTPPDRVKAILGGWSEGNAVVKAIRTDRHMIERIGKLVDYGNIAEGAAREKYWEAASSCLSLFVQTPMLKLVKANAEIYTSLLYTGLSAHEATARVEQFSRLADDQLRAVNSLAKTYEKHLKLRRTLLKEQEQIRAEQGF
ncbi:hypothetical protein OP10G_4366 [Fimbriimonas ginsengisoli Gsoil 348]|uniref:Uncharacterized protein n=1 Tax=Fimbriimonas ginsengisoli Gsoil 348 TaxID=661478 RepID=A0A068NZ05_FIMGI|nr:hypothetical protein OP10G_4366 [Fimbriimonas ginsengisoli Gsoil 348]